MCLHWPLVILALVPRMVFCLGVLVATVPLISATTIDTPRVDSSKHKSIAMDCAAPDPSEPGGTTGENEAAMVYRFRLADVGVVEVHEYQIGRAHV